MQDVELVEQEPGVPELPARRRPTRRWRVPAVVAGVAVLGGLAAFQAAADGRVRADLERAAEVTGTLEPVGDRLRTRWAPPDDGSAPRFSALVGPHLVAAEATDDGVLRVQEVDRGTGEPRWTTAVPTGPVTARPDVPVTCEPLDGPAGAARVVCAVVAPRRPTLEPPGPRPTTFAVLDAADGTLVTVRTVSTQLWTATGGSVVLASMQDTADGAAWVVLATDLAAADGPVDAWRTTTPARDRSIAIGADGQVLAWQDLQASADRLLLTDGDHAWLLGTDGTLLRSIDTDARVATLGRTGLVGLVDWSAASGFDRPRGSLVVGNGAVRVRETLQPPSVDDGTAPEVEVMQSFDGPVVVRSGRTGGELWRSREDVTATMLLGGVLYASSADGVVARDAVTGRRVWSADAADVSRLATDGRVLLALSSSLTVHAYRLTDGAALWSQDARDLSGDPSGTGRWLTTGWGVLALATPDGFTVVG